MKAIIELAITVFVAVVGVNIIIIIKDLELGIPSNFMYRIPLIILPSIGIYGLYGLYDFLSQQEKARLNKKVVQETRRALKNPDGYELWPTLTHYLILLLIFAGLGIAPLFFGIKLLYEFHETVMVILLLLMLLFGLFFGFGLLHSLFLLAGRPVIRINRQGISHFLMEFIDWHGRDRFIFTGRHSQRGKIPFF